MAFLFKLLELKDEIGMASNMPSAFRLISCRKDRGAHRGGDSSRAPYGLKIIESCIACPYRKEEIFCNLSPSALQHLATITSPSTYPKGATLFIEGEEPRGIFILCQGRAKLSTTSIDGKTLITRIAEAGDVLGLPGTVSGKPYELRAEILEPTQANFISRTDFLKFLAENGGIGVRVAQQLAEIYQAAIAEMRTIGVGHSATEKLARLLLDLVADADRGPGEIKIALTFTHEEIAQIIGTSRETVTRLLSVFRKKDLVYLKGSTLIVRNKAGLARLTGD
jgi:CRP/FNR family transcriptional regulator, cyclic AMP receptor protein